MPIALKNSMTLQIHIRIKRKTAVLLLQSKFIFYILRMNRKIHQFLAEDHSRLDDLLNKALLNPDEIDLESYHLFRIGLLKLIKMEEKILFPAAKKANGNVPIPLAAKLRLDHGALTMLMLLSPTRELAKVITFILQQHDELEEQEGGMYDICENLTENETAEILEKLKATTEVPVHPYNDSEIAFQSAKNALLRAGFDYETILNG